MSSPEDVSMSEGDNSVHEPFTVEENIHQLNAIDASIVQLMSHTATALNALTVPPSSATTEPLTETSVETAPKPPLDPPSQKEAFRSATDSFLAALHSIDVRMKRQIFALEEAGIVNLANMPKQGAEGHAKASLKPNGIGAVGNLDVGWLNSRGARVERDMEAELWGDAKDLLEEDGDKLKM